MYRDERGEQHPIPDITSSKKDIYDFVLSCMKDEIPEITDNQIEEYWGMMEEKNKLILRYLEALKNKHEMEGDRGRVFGYLRAIRAMKGINFPITSGDEAQKIKGIGPKIGQKIDEILTTGKLDVMDERVRADIEKQEIIERFTTVSGIGFKTAAMLYEQGYRTIEELEEAPLTEHAQIGLRYYEDFLKRIPREQISEVEPMLREALTDVEPKAKFCICGSYRREKPTSGDIDVLISSNVIESKELLHDYVKELVRKGFLIDQISLGSMKYMGVAMLDKNPRRIDIKYVPWQSWATGMLHFTGSDDFNKRMRVRAIELGYTLSEYSLKNDKTGEIVPVRTEKDVFDALGMKYLPPRERK